MSLVRERETEREFGDFQGSGALFCFTFFNFELFMYIGMYVVCSLIKGGIVNFINPFY